LKVTGSQQMSGPWQWGWGTGRQDTGKLMLLRQTGDTPGSRGLIPSHSSNVRTETAGGRERRTRKGGWEVGHG
jgi:hypothetical protein